MFPTLHSIPFVLPLRPLRVTCECSQYDGDKWDVFYEKIPISLLHHTNGNAIYNTSHPLLERLVGQLEVEAPCPYNSIPYDYRSKKIFPV